MNRSENRIPFHPAVGSESVILKQEPREGWVWFATDSKKIYYSDGNTHLPMGGNSSIFYGTKSFEDEIVDEGQTEFIFSVYEIDGNQDILDNNFKIPNVDDLILNEDGCFYRVTDINGEAEDTEIYTIKLTIAGTGNGDNDSDDSNVGKLTFTNITEKQVTCLYNRPFAIEFNVTAVDAAGDMTGNGTYSVEVNGVKDVLKGICRQGKNSVEIGSKLSLGDNTVRIYVTMDIGGSGLVTQSKSWQIKTTQIEMTWDYDQTQINNLDEDFTLRFKVSGYNIQKTVKVIIDDYIELFPNNFTQTSEQAFTFSPSDLGLGHGAHKVQLIASAIVGDVVINDIPIITKNIIFVDSDNSTAIISCCFFENRITQYNTVQIPIIFYQKDNGANILTATLKENGNEVDHWKNLANGQVYIWNYTPLVSETRRLSIHCNEAEKYLTLQINAINIDNEEVNGYAFRFKTSDYSSNSAIQAEAAKDNKITFSENFDWINGGLKNEIDSKGYTRQYFCVKAGTTMTINYQLFNKNATANGKAFKFIFKATGCRDYDARVLDCYDDDKSIGLRMTAQNALLQGSANRLDIPYCEDSYIEFEFDITKTDKVKRYMMPWMDGVPVGLKPYSTTEQFMHNKNIVIGSNDCDVWVYMIKIYESHISDEGHLQNFIADAPNAQEMLDRYERNDIMDKERGIISPSRLAEKNPDCRVHVYDISRMTLNKKDKIKKCTYKQYHGGNTPILTADNVTIKVQGTSSASYGLAAFNLDSEFESGFKLADGTVSEGWSMNPNSIPVNYFCTKVNVASCEHASNTLNQEWQNRYQPYKTVLREKNPNARDTMEFVPGVLFIQDHNTQKDMENSNNFISNNVFAEIDGYVTDDPETTGLYPRMYSICNMGNSKKNVEVLHDTTNPIEYCIEVADNQKPMQWMTQCDYTDDAWDADEPDWEFRYPDGHSEIDNSPEKATFVSPWTNELVTNRQHAFDAWRRFITWMAKTNPQPAYQEENVTNQAQLDALLNRVSSAINKVNEKIADQQRLIGEYQAQIDWIRNDRPDEELSDEDKAAIAEYEEKIEAAESLIAELEDEKSMLPAEVYTGVKTENGVGLIAKPVLLEGNSYTEGLTYYTKTTNTHGYDLSPLENPVTYDTYTFSNSRYTRQLAGTTVTTYNGTYTHDTYAYRMAKMLNECEQYLVMDSVMFHYLYIERHTMIDNVSKNTFWSTEDGLHWNLTKDYDNDTSDGNDNQGKLTLTYGIEPLDNLPGSTTDFYFNANQSVWFRFCGGLYPVARALYNKLESTGDDGKENAWDSKAYLQAFENWQQTIPERCWIEDYYRKYVRPLEIYGDSMFVDMLEGGQKVHQRKQYETYQDYYMSSKYIGKAASDNRIIIRGNGNEYANGLPVSMYADCYIQAAFGSGNEPNVSARVKRNEEYIIQVPSKLGTMDNATIYFFLPQLYQTIGKLNHGSLNILLPEQITVSPAAKLRTLIAGEYNERRQTDSDQILLNQSLEEIGFDNNTMLEELHICNYIPAATLGDLDLSNAVNLKTLDARNSGFTSIKIADGAPITNIKLANPGTLELTNLRHLDDLSFENIGALRTLLIDNIDTDKISSKNDILDKATGLTTYRLRNVDWTIDTIVNQINIADKSINVLQKLLSMTPYTEQDQTTQATHADSLSGNLTISANLDAAVAQAIYEKYSLGATLADVVYPNLNINFSNADLFTITVVNGTSETMWERKFVKGYDMTANDLAQSSYGAFNKDKIMKPSTEYYTYTFAKKWNVYNSDTKEVIQSNVEGETPPLLSDINANITIEPIFEEIQRGWTVAIYNGENLIYSGNCNAGNTLERFLQEQFPIIPFKTEDPNNPLPLTETYSFMGYALTSEATVPMDLSNYIVSNNVTLYTLFEQISVYDNIHLDYFDYELTSYNSSDDEIDENFYITEGYIARPKIYLGLSGKITIPAVYDGKPVCEIADFNPWGDESSNVDITHVFVGRVNKNDPASANLRVVRAGCFNNFLNLQYFDFGPSLRMIRDQAFRKTPLKPNYSDNSFFFGENLFLIGYNAFNQSLSFNGKTSIDLIISDKLTRLGSKAFSYLIGDTGTNTLNIYIGDQNNMSNLDVLVQSSDASDYECFKFNYQLIGTLQFYSKNYTSWSQSIGDHELHYWLGSQKRKNTGDWELYTTTGVESV